MVHNRHKNMGVYVGNKVHFFVCVNDIKMKSKINKNHLRKAGKDHLLKAVHLQRILINFLEQDQEVWEIENLLGTKYITEEVEKAKTVYGIVLRNSIKFENEFPKDPVEQAKLIVCDNPEQFPRPLIDWAAFWGHKV